MRKTLALVAIALAGFGIGLAGCGGEEDNGSPGQGTTDTVMTTKEDEDDGVY